MFVVHAKALHGNPYDGHTLGPVVDELSDWIGARPERIYVDKGYAGHRLEAPLSVFRSGQKRGVATARIKRELKRRAAIEPIIGHIKAEHRMDRNFLHGRDGDRANAVLAAAGFNFKQIANWLRRLLCLLLAQATVQSAKPPNLNPAGSRGTKHSRSRRFSRYRRGTAGSRHQRE